MNPKSVLRIVYSVGLAAAVTFLTFWGDKQVNHKKLDAHRLDFARQIVAQFHSLVMSSQKLSDLRSSEAETWAAQQLDQGFVLSNGTLRKMVRVHLVDDRTIQKSETFKLDPQLQYYDYVKKLDSGVHQGIRVQIQSPYLGFLGAATKDESDLRVAAVFLVFFGLFYFLFGSMSSRETVLDAPPGREPRPKKWHELQTLQSTSMGEFTNLSREIRDLVRQARDLIKSSHRAHQSLQDLQQQNEDPRVEMSLEDLDMILENSQNFQATLGRTTDQMGTHLKSIRLVHQALETAQNSDEELRDWKESLDEEPEFGHQKTGS